MEEILKGNSLGERHRHLNELVSAAGAGELSPDVLSSLSQKSQLDQIYLVKVADRLKHARLVCEFLKSEDALIVSKALKCCWFFEAVQSTDAILEDIFPFASFATRSRIVTKLGQHLRSTKVAEEFYVKSKGSGGPLLAAKLLPACSENFIRAELSSFSVPLPSLQLKYMYKKYPHLVVDYLEGLLSSENSPPNYCHMSEYQDTFLLIAKDCPEYFQALYSKYHQQITFDLGYRTTVTLLQDNSKLIIENAWAISSRLNSRAVVDTMKRDDFDKFIVALLSPQRCNYLPSNVSRFLKYWKPDYAATYIIEIYNKAYNDSALYTGFIPVKFMESLPIEVRVAWAKNMLGLKGNTEESYLKYFTIEESFKRYKELMQSASDIQQRSRILEGMIESCRINKDEKALLSLLEYFMKRFRNDLEELRFNFFQNVQNSFRLHKLSPDHWKFFDEMLAIMYYNNEVINNYRQYFLHGILKEKILFCLINNLEFETVVDVMIKYNLNNMNIPMDNVDYEKRVLDVFFQKYKTLIVDKPMNDDVERHIVLLLAAYRTWNQNHKSNKCSVTECDWLMEEVRRWLKNQDGSKTYNQILTHLWDDPSARKVFLMDIINNRFFDDKTLRFLLKEDTNILLEYIDSLVETTMCYGEFKKHVKKIRAYVNKPLGEILRRKIIEKIENSPDDCASDISWRLIFLSYLLNPADYEAFLQKYIPESMKLDLTNHDDEKAKEHQIIVKVVENFKHVNPPISYELLLKFAQNDYLKNVLPSLLSFCFRKNMQDTVKFINELSKKPVSVKKHSIRLSYFLFDKNLLPPFYESIWDKEKNSSIRDVIFQRTFHLLKKDPDQAYKQICWNSLKHLIQSFEEKDKNLFSYLAEPQAVGPALRVEYIEVCWDQLNKLQASNVDVTSTLKALIIGITWCIDEMNEEFCDVIIHRYLSSIVEHTDISDALLDFCVMYLVKAKSADIQKNRTRVVLSNFKTFISEKWNENIVQGYTRYTVGELINKCCNQIIIDLPSFDMMPLLSELENMLDSVLPFGAVFDEHVYLWLTMKTVEKIKLAKSHKLTAVSPATKEFLNSLAKDTIKILEDLVARFGPEVHYLFLTIFKKFTSYIFHLPMFLIDIGYLKVLFVGEILNVDNKNRHVMHFAIDLLPAEKIKNATLQQSLLDRLVANADETIKMIAYNRFKMPSTIFAQK